jgi:DsbC/DsbD-like thiol-disulfide interchange protein
MSRKHMKSASRRLAYVLAGHLTALALSLTPALSLDSGWAETEGGRMRLVVDPTPRDDGTIGGFLDIALDPGWKTYWREPGSAGIPPTLDFSQSRAVTFEAMQYPPPERIDDGYAIWAGYTAPVQFPLTFRRNGPEDARIHALAFVGICEKVCVPFQAELIVDLPDEVNIQDPAKTAVDEAFSLLPETAATDFRVEKARLDLAVGQLTVQAKLPDFRPAGVDAELFIAGPQGFAFAPPRLISDENGLVEWSMRVEPPSGMDRASEQVPLEIVVTLGQRAIGQSLVVTPAPE